MREAAAELQSKSYMRSVASRNAGHHAAMAAEQARHDELRAELEATSAALAAARRELRRVAAPPPPAAGSQGSDTVEEDQP